MLGTYDVLDPAVPIEAPQPGMRMHAFFMNVG